MITLIWKKYNHRYGIDITTEDNIPDTYLTELVRRLCGGDLDCIGTQPRSRDWVYFQEDAKILEQPQNIPCTGLVGKALHGDCVIVTPDTHRRIQNGQNH